MLTLWLRMALWLAAAPLVGGLGVVSILFALVVDASSARAAPAARPSDGPPDLVEKAYSAAEQKRYCDAAPLFLSLHERAPQATHLYRAAEVAYAAGDYVWAQDLYRSVKDAYPTFEKMPAVDKRLTELAARIKSSGAGTPCPTPATVCGDWIIRPGEQCDDGNTVDGDGCDGNCTMPVCGNGRRVAPEECDDGNLVDGDGCDGNCTLSRCGNGVVTAGEECDDGNLEDGDGCDANCTITRCGNRIVTDGEQCDDGNDISGDGCDRNCMITRCGNGARDGDEACDDGNAVDGDGCDRNCTASACGNGVRAPNEECDDGNLLDGDGCNADCTLPDQPGSAAPAGTGSTGGASGSTGGLLLTGGGAVLLATAAVALVVGLLPLIDHARVSRQIEDAERRADSDPASALAEARLLQRQAADAEVRWQTYGAPLTVAGAVGVAAGLGLAALGVGWLLGGDDDSNPALDPNDEERVP